MEKESSENKNVFVIVRETVQVKKQLEEKSRASGFGTLSEFIRDMWRQWL